MRHFFCFLLLGFILPAGLFAQISLPYTQNFDTALTGWSHYAIYGSDSWGLGTFDCNNYSPPSLPYAWKTGLVNRYAPSSKMCLQSPYFNLSTVDSPGLSFIHVYNFDASSSGYVEYSLDSGVTWNTLAPISSINWGASFGGSVANFRTVYADLTPLQAYSAVTFRFTLVSSSIDTGNYCGWIVDNFRVDNSNNLLKTITGPGPKVEYSTFVPNVSFKFPAGVSDPSVNLINAQIQCWISTDSILSADDSLFYTTPLTSIYYGDSVTVTCGMPKLGELNKGTYYLIHHIFPYSPFMNDSIGTISYNVMIIDSTFKPGFADNFEILTGNWKNSSSLAADSGWAWEAGNLLHIEGAHSGITGFADYHPQGSPIDYLTSPILDDGLDSTAIFSFWYKTYNSSLSLEMNTNFLPNGWNSIANMGFPGYSLDDEWQFMNVSLSQANYCRFLQLRFSNQTGKALIDDAYFGKPLPDLTLEREKQDRYTRTDSSTFTLGYWIYNSGMDSAHPSVSRFYWSTDSVITGNAILVATVNEPGYSPQTMNRRMITFNKPVNTAGTYFILYQLDVYDSVNEIFETNNTGYYRIWQQSPVPYLYSSGFNSGADTLGWYHNASLGHDQWVNQTDSESVVSAGFKTSPAWILRKDSSNGENSSHSFLYSPIMDFSASVKPVISFDLFNFAAYSETFPGTYLNMSYSTDGGNTWDSLNIRDSSWRCWYNDFGYDNNGGDDQFQPDENSGGIAYSNLPVFSQYFQYQGRDSKSSTHYVLHAPQLAGFAAVKLRFNLFSDSVAMGSVVIDNFSVTEGTCDLLIDYRKSLGFGNRTKSMRFDINVLNQGTLASSATSIRYYLSSDTILDASDYLLGTDTLPPIQPQRYYYHEAYYPSLPVNISGYNYLIYDIDPHDLVNDNDRSNNIGYWPLGMTPISTFPYVNNFDDSVTDGWKTYVDAWFGIGADANYFRLRNTKVTGDLVDNLCPDRKPGVYFTDFDFSFSYGSSSFPTWYLESPVFDFTNDTAVNIYFDLVCIGSNNFNSSNGATLEYSTDGDSTWNALGSDPQANSSNWFNDHIRYFSSEAGWDGIHTTLTPTYAYHLSQLANQPYVTFRFKFASNYDPYNDTRTGFGVDNFTVSTDTTFYFDFVALDTCNETYTLSSSTQLTVPLSFINTGNTYADDVSLQLQWSSVSGQTYSASIGDSTINEMPPGQIVVKSITIPAPAGACDTLLYLQYTLNSNGLYQEPAYNDYGCIKIRLPYNNIGASIAASDTSINCNGTPVVLTTDTGNYNIIWSTGATTSQIIVDSSGTYSVNLENSLSHCIYSSASTLIHAESPEQIHLHPSATHICNDSASISYTSVYGITQLIWSNGDTTQSIFIGHAGPVFAQAINVYNCPVYSDTVEIFEDTIPSLLVTGSPQDTALCAGAQLSLVVVNANPIWSTGQTSTVIYVSQPGSYFAQFSNACGSFNTDTVNVRYRLIDSSISVTGPAAPCKGDTVIFSALSGYTYLWSTGSSDSQIVITQAGTYSLELQDTGCLASASKSIQFYKPIATIQAVGDSVFCQGDSLLITAYGNYTFQWSNGQTGSDITVYDSGQYYVVATDTHGCKDTTSAINVVVNTPPTVPVITANGTVLSSSTWSNYQWYFDGIAIPGANGQSYTVVEPGYYSVLIIDPVTGCSSMSQDYSYLTGIDNLTEQGDIHVFPNPAGNVVNWYAADVDGPDKLDLSTVTGEIIGHFNLTDINIRELQSLSLSELNDGLYFLTFYRDKILIKTIKLVKI